MIQFNNIECGCFKPFGANLLKVGLKDTYFSPTSITNCFALHTP